MTNIYNKLSINIPIGFDCSVASQLRDKNIRKFALPFDWNILNIGSIYNIINSIIEEQNIDILNSDNIIFAKKYFTHKYENDSKIIVKLLPIFDKKYKILFVHDLKYDDYIKDPIIAINNLREKYLNRIKRLKHILSNENYIFAYKNDENSYKKKIYDHWNSFFDINIINLIEYYDNDNIILDKIKKITGHNIELYNL